MVIDYLPKTVEADNLKYPILNKEEGRTILKKVAVKINWLLGFSANITRYNKFNRFINRTICKTKKFYTYHELRNETQIDGADIDTFVCESDVIWKVTDRGNFDENFFLDFPAASKHRKVAYAPTLSSTELKGDLLRDFKDLISSFSAISAREDKGAEYLSKLTGNHVETVLDPTLLLNANDYDHICIKPKEKGYLLIYNVTQNDIIMVKEAMRFAKLKGLKVVEISNYAINQLIVPHVVKVGVGIEEWIGYIKYADVICTNSFHGFCFSVIYKKDIFLFQRDDSDYKMQNIAHILGMDDRLIPYNKKKIPANTEPTDYIGVYAKLHKYRKTSDDYIKTNIIM